MKIKDMFGKGKPLFTFEIFPPKKASPVDTIYKTLDGLKELSPDFISVTYGAGGTGVNSDTVKIASIIKDTYHIEPMAHLTCLTTTREDVSAMLDELKRRGVENILALRGDESPDRPPCNDFQHANELITMITEHGGFDIAAACYPECHLDAPNLVTDIQHLKQKVDAGASHLISQLFFQNDAFYRFQEMTAVAGINVPIEAGIMPVTNKKQIERMVTMCGASLPAKFSKMMARYENSPEALRDAGIAYAVDQIIDLVSQGVDGIHLYTMNNPAVAKRIYEAVVNIIRA